MRCWSFGENNKQLSDRVNEAKALEWEGQLAVVELEGNFKRLSDRVNVSRTRSRTSGRLFWWNFHVRNCLPSMRWRPDMVVGGTSHNSLRTGLTRLLEMMVVVKGSGAWHPLTPPWMPCGRGSVGALPRRDRGDSQVRCLAWVWWRSSSLTVNCGSLVWGYGTDGSTNFLRLRTVGVTPNSGC